MRRTFLPVATGVAVAMGASSSIADPNFTGSDTMLGFIRLLLEDCTVLGTPAQQAACAALVYSGGGSTAGQTDLIATYATPTTKQTIAPMARELNSAACGAKQATAKGWVLSLDAVSMVSNVAVGEVCDPPPIDEDPFTPGSQEFGANLRRSGTLTLQDLGRNSDGRPVNIAGNPATGMQVPPLTGPFLNPRLSDGIVCRGCGAVAAGLPTDTNDTTYTFQDITLGTSVIPGTAWQDVLRILYTGATHSMGNTRVGIASGNGANLANTLEIASFCGGDLRRSLVAQWQNIVEGCASEGACVGGVRRLFRRGDASGLTDTFLALLNLPSIRNNPGSTQSGALPFGSPLSGIPVPGSPFCNGNDQRDNDPIRIACKRTSSGEAVDLLCNRYVVDNAGTASLSKDDEIINSLGLLLPIFVPQEFTWFANVPTPGMPPSLPLPMPDISSVHAAAGSGTGAYENFRKFPRPLCGTIAGVGRAPTDPDTGNAVAICPDGTPALGGTCWVPATSGSSGAYPACLNAIHTNLPFNVATHFSSSAAPGSGCGPSKNLNCRLNGFFPDGRVYNATVYNPPPSLPPPGSYGNTTSGVRVAQYSRVIVGSAAEPLRDVTMALYRLRQTVRPVSPAPIAPDVCAFHSSSENIACLVGNYGATECALGIAGVPFVAATALTQTVDMKVNAIPRTDAQVRAGAYPFTRRLFINTLDNVDAGQPDQFGLALNPFQTNLATFMGYLDANPATVNTRADQLGFISVPLGAGGLECVDFRADQLNPALPAGAAGNTCPTSDAIDACF